jgi:hypothetical protein
MQPENLHPLSSENIKQNVIMCDNFIRSTYQLNLDQSSLHKILANIHHKNFEFYKINPPDTITC